MDLSDGPQLKIYSSQQFLPSGVPHVAMLYPFWGFPPSERSPEMYRIYAELGPRYFRPVPAQDADFFVLPFDWRYGTREGRRTEDVAMAMAARSAAQSFSERALELGKRLIVFYVGDSEEEVPLEDSVVFRTSLRRGARSNEFAMVVFFEDVVGRRLGSCLPLRPKLNSPSVGFCGFAGYRLMPGVDFVRKVRRIARWLRDGIPAPTDTAASGTPLRFNRLHPPRAWRRALRVCRTGPRRILPQPDQYGLHALCARNGKLVD